MSKGIVGIVEDWLRDSGYSGLANRGMQCGCGLGDLFLCGSASDECEPGYEHVCVGRELCRNGEECEGETGDRCFTTTPWVESEGSDG